MTPETRQAWAGRLDAVVAWCAALLPAGVVAGNAGFEGLVALAGAAFLARCVLARRNPLSVGREESVVLAWAAWWGVMVVSVAANGPGGKGVGHDLAFARYLLFLAACVDTGTRRPLFGMMARGLAAGVVLGAVNTLSAYGFGFDLLGRRLSRYTGKLKEASRLSGLSAFAAPFFLGWAASAGKRAGWRRAALVGLCALSFGQAIQTQVRTAILGAVAGLAFVAGFLGFTRRGARAATLVAGACLAAALAVFVARGAFDPTHLYDRVYIWKVSAAVWRESPVLGSGVSSFQDAFRREAAPGGVPPWVSPDGRSFHVPAETHAHNLVLMLLASTGLAGLAAFAALFVLAARRALATCHGPRTGLCSWPVVVLVLGLTGFNVYHSWYQALLAFFMAMIVEAKREKNLEP